MGSDGSIQFASWTEINRIQAAVAKNGGIIVYLGEEFYEGRLHCVFRDPAGALLYVDNDTILKQVEGRVDSHSKPEEPQASVQISLGNRTALPVEDMRSDYLRGMDLKEIAKKYQCSYRTAWHQVTKVLAAHGEVLRKRGSKLDWEKIEHCVRSGMSVKEAAWLGGCRVDAVYKHYKKMGKPFRRKGKWLNE